MLMVPRVIDAIAVYYFMPRFFLQNFYTCAVGMMQFDEGYRVGYQHHGR